MTPPLNVSVPEALEASMVPPLPNKLMTRSLLSVVPVYCKTPVAPRSMVPLPTVVGAPKELVELTSANLATLNVPSLIVVLPV